MPVGTPENDREKFLQDWLDRNNAVMLWFRKHTANMPEISCYSAHGNVFIVCRFKNNRGGWQIFCPPSDSIKSDTTLDDAAVLMGPKFQGTRGL